MRKVLAIICLLTSSITANAECSSMGITVWPVTNTIKSNPVIIIDFYEYSQRIANELNKKYTVYLKSKTQKIPLTISEICQGEFRLTQVVLRPAIELTKGMEYELVIEGEKLYERIDKWNNQTFTSKPAKWTVEEEHDTTPPKWIALPKYHSKTFIGYGCGPEKFIYFDFTTDDPENIIIKTTVKSISTGKSTSYYVQQKESKLQVGHDMCSGAFAFNNGDEYEVSFSLMDASGNLSNQSTPYRFSKPTEKGSVE